MDCEKFENTLLDELYDELDEVTSAAAKRHVSGCSRCASLLSGLKATRRLAVLPIVEPPADLEDRIMAAAREAQKVVPLRRRASHAISWAGSWAMRPQTGMAAVFLLMTGISALLLRVKHSAPASAVTVSEQGEPVGSPTASTREPPENLPHKTTLLPAFAPPPPPTSVPAAADTVADGLVGRGRAATSAGDGAGRVNAAPKPRAMESSKRLVEADDCEEYKSAPIAAAPPAAQRYAPPSPGAGGGAGGTSGAFAAQPAAQAMSAPLQAPGSPTPQSQSSTGFSSAMASYNSGDYAAATTLFDGLASAGDLTSALWAARSARRGSGCPAAAARFDQVARAGAGTTTGYDATFEGGQCYRQMGQLDMARARFGSLITVPSYVDRAKNELAQMGPKAAAKVAPKGWSQQAPASQQASPSPDATKPVDAK